MRVLVLGSDGFVARRLVAALAQSDWATPVELARSQSLDSAVDQVAGVANCVTGRPATIQSTAEALFRAVTRSSRRIPVVHLGSMTVYGSANGTFAEQAATPADLGPYAQAQLAADQLAAAYPEAIRLRPGCEYGPECQQWSGLIARRLLQHRLGDLGAGGDGYCNLLYVDDLVNAIQAALRRPELRGQAFNLAVPSPPTWNEYFAAFAKALGAVPLRRLTRRRLAIETKLLAVPLKVAEMAAQRLGLAKLPLPPPIPPSLLRLCRQEIRLDVRAAESLLGMRWTAIDTGLRRAADWVLAARRSR